MASLFRLSTPADAAEIVSLAERCLGVRRDGPMFAAEQLEWKYWSEAAGEPMPRSYVLVRDRRIVAHAGVWPLAVRQGVERCTVLHPFDWMSEPSAIGSGAALLTRLAELADAILIVGGSQITQRMVRPLGFQTLDDVLRYAAPSSQEGPQSTDEDGELAVVRVAEPIVLDCARARPPEPWSTFERTPARLALCQRCPAAPMGVYSVCRAQHRVGTFVLAQAPRQARLTAFWSATGRLEDLTLIARLARREARDSLSAHEIVAMASDPLEQQALGGAGFRAAGWVPMFLRASHPALLRGVRLGFQMLDGDVAFLHHGSEDPWI